MLNNSGGSGHPCLVPDLRGNAFSFSPLRIMFGVDVSYMAFFYVEVGSFYAHFLVTGARRSPTAPGELTPHPTAAA